MGMKEFKHLKRVLASVSKIGMEIPPLQMRLEELNNNLDEKIKERNAATKKCTKAKNRIASWDASRIANEKESIETLELEIVQLDENIRLTKEEHMKKRSEREKLLKPLLEERSKYTHLYIQKHIGIRAAIISIVLSLVFISGSVFLWDNLGIFGALGVLPGFCGGLLLGLFYILISLSLFELKKVENRKAIHLIESQNPLGNWRGDHSRGTRTRKKKEIYRIKSKILRNTDGLADHLSKVEKERSNKQRRADYYRKKIAEVRKQLDELLQEREKLMGSVSHMIPFANHLPDDPMKKLTGD